MKYIRRWKTVLLIQEVWPDQRWGQYDNDGWVPSSSNFPGIPRKLHMYMRSQVAAFGCQWLRWPLPSAGRRYNCTDFKFLILLKRSRTLWRLELLCLGSSSQTSRTSRISRTWRTSTFWQISHNSALTAVIKKRNVHSSLSQSYTFFEFLDEIASTAPAPVCVRLNLNTGILKAESFFSATPRVQFTHLSRNENSYRRSAGVKANEGLSLENLSIECKDKG